MVCYVSLPSTFSSFSGIDDTNLEFMDVVSGLPLGLAPGNWRGLCLEDGMVGLGYVVNNHVFFFRPLRIGLDWTPPKWPNFMAYKWG